MWTERHGNSSSASPEDNAMFLDILQEAPLFGHRKSRRAIVGAIAYCVLLAGYAVLAAAAPLIFRHIDDLVPSLLCSCHVLLLMLTGSCAIDTLILEVKFRRLNSNRNIKFTILAAPFLTPNANLCLGNGSAAVVKGFLLTLSGFFQQYFVSQVQKIRLQGYYSFSQKLKHIVRLPFAITAYGTAAMLLVMVWRHKIEILSVSALLRIIMLTEAICAGSCMSIYIGYLNRYNSLNSEPDILKSLYSPLQQSSPLEGLRYHDGGRLSDQQMALLQYQRENLHFLSEEVLRLQESLSKYERSSDGSTPQVDLAHMLAAREQELRTVTAEMNQLQSELRLARSLIAERDSEVQKVCATNNQYVEENERLRAILGEWSNRAAKLERALEVERMSNLELQKKLSTSRSQSNVSTEQSEHRGP